MKSAFKKLLVVTILFVTLFASVVPAEAAMFRSTYQYSQGRTTSFTVTMDKKGKFKLMQTKGRAKLLDPKTGRTCKQISCYGSYQVYIRMVKDGSGRNVSKTYSNWSFWADEWFSKTLPKGTYEVKVQSVGIRIPLIHCFKTYYSCWTQVPKYSPFY